MNVPLYQLTRVVDNTNVVSAPDVAAAPDVIPAKAGIQWAFDYNEGNKYIGRSRIGLSKGYNA